MFPFSKVKPCALELVKNEFENISNFLRLFCRNCEKLRRKCMTAIKHPLETLRQEIHHFLIENDVSSNKDSCALFQCKSFAYNRAKNLTTTPVTLDPNEEKCRLGTYVAMQPNPLMYNMSVTWQKTTSHVPTNVYDGCKLFQSFTLLIRSN